MSKTLPVNRKVEAPVVFNLTPREQGAIDETVAEQEKEPIVGPVSMTAENEPIEPVC